jgi:hypothetical protein
MIKKRMLLLALVGLGLVGCAEHGHAQASSSKDWPAGTVKFIAPFAAGGTSDTLGRIAAEHLRGKLAQQFYVENRVGAGGMIGSHEVAAAAPDGYTFRSQGLLPTSSRPPSAALRPTTGCATSPTWPIWAAHRWCWWCMPRSACASSRSFSITPSARPRVSTTCLRGSARTVSCSPRTWRGASISS